jgi:hypothetical protein
MNFLKYLNESFDKWFFGVPTKNGWYLVRNINEKVSKSEYAKIGPVFSVLIKGGKVFGNSFSSNGSDIETFCGLKHPFYGNPRIWFGPISEQEPSRRDVLDFMQEYREKTRNIRPYSDEKYDSMI